mgnify:CR=1 FL=1
MYRYINVSEKYLTVVHIAALNMNLFIESSTAGIQDSFRVCVRHENGQEAWKCGNISERSRPEAETIEGKWYQSISTIQKSRCKYCTVRYSV